MQPIKYVTAVSLLFAASSAIAEEGSIGMSVEIGVDGIFKPNIAQAKVKEAFNGSPAEAAGIRPGDLITRIEDCKIPGCPASKAKTLMAKEPGQLLKLTVLHEDKTEQEITIKVGKKSKTE